jgi:VIT1/CCC1 family predicted Fe2+/Mn2+ transporter
MNTIQLLNKLQATGLGRESSEAIAQAIEERNKELATKSDIKSLKEFIFFGFGAMSAVLAYIVIKI